MIDNIKPSKYKCKVCGEPLEYNGMYGWRSTEPDVVTAELQCTGCKRRYSIKERPQNKKERK